MAVPKYYVIYPDGSIKYFLVSDKDRLRRFHEVIGCDCVEQVRTVVPGVCLLVDESGRIKSPPQQHNETASWFYLGYILGRDDIVGPAILISLRPIDPLGELDWFPLSIAQEDFLSDLLKDAQFLGGAADAQ